MTALTAMTAGEAVQVSEGNIDTTDWIVFGSIVVGALILAVAFARFVRRSLSRLSVEETISSLASRLAGSVVIVIGLVYALSRVGVRVGPLLGAIGIGGLALALAVQGVLSDVLAGIVLHGRRPFGIGDEIDTADHRGRVLDIGTRAVELRGYGGSHTFIPNSTVLGNPFTNTTAEALRRTTLDVGVAYGTSLASALAVLTEAAASVADVAAEPPPEAHVVGFGDSGIDLALRYWHAPRDDAMWRVRTEVALALEARFAEAEITIPFPQRVLWHGVSGGGAEPPHKNP